MNRWECMTCSYIYSEGLEKVLKHVPKQISFEALSCTWKCPECGASKQEFMPEITAKALKHRHD